MSIVDFITVAVANDQARLLVVLVLANFVLGVVQAVSTKTFTLVRVGDYARTRLLPVLVVYAMAALVTWAAPTDPIFGKVRDVVFTTEVATLSGLLFANLKDFGVPVPATLAGK